MARLSIRLPNLPVATLAVAVAGIGAAALMLGNGERVVERGFERALASMAKPPMVVSDDARLDSDRLRLTRVAHDADALVAKPVSVGDRITITSDGRERVLSVVTVDRLDRSIIPTSGERPTELLLVTCREEANPRARPVRLLIEADEELPALSGVKRSPSRV